MVDVSIWERNPLGYNGPLCVCPDYGNKGREINTMLKRRFESGDGIVPYLPQDEVYESLSIRERQTSLCATVSFFIDHRLPQELLSFYSMPLPKYSGYITLHLRKFAQEKGYTVPPMTPVLSGYSFSTPEEINDAWFHQVAWAYRNHLHALMTYPAVSGNKDYWDVVGSSDWFE